MKTSYLLSTGGTIEKVYSEHTGSVANVSSKIDRYLRLLRLPDAEINIVPLMLPRSATGLWSPSDPAFSTANAVSG